MILQTVDSVNAGHEESTKSSSHRVKNAHTWHFLSHPMTHRNTGLTTPRTCSIKAVSNFGKIILTQVAFQGLGCWVNDCGLFVFGIFFFFKVTEGLAECRAVRVSEKRCALDYHLSSLLPPGQIQVSHACLGNWG